MKHAFLLAFALATMGFSCVLPQRTRTILPPTSERELCQWDSRFFYSKTYDFCFRYPDGWQSVVNSGAKTIVGTNITGNTFSLASADGTLFPIFTLYVTGYSDQGLADMISAGVTVSRSADPYVIGYTIREPLDNAAKPYAAAVPKMLESIQVFAAPQGRQ